MDKKIEFKCEVCEETAPPGHRFCDNCWPDAAIGAGLAARCELCGTAKVLSKLRRNEQSQLICMAH